MAEKILVIKHGALGDIFMALGAFKAIREYHHSSKISILTSKAFSGLIQQMGYFDEVLIDKRSPYWDLKASFDIYRKLHGNKKGRFDRIYDLQNSQRSRSYFKMLKFPKNEWVGNVKGCSHPHPRDSYKHHHISEYYKILFKNTGIDNIPKGEISWLKSDVSKFKLDYKYAVFIPGCSKDNLEKRWSAENFKKVNEFLAKKNIKTILIGRDEDQEIIDEIIKLSNGKNIINLMNKTSFADLVEIGRGAELILGGDTGPMHILSYLTKPMIMFFSAKSLFELVAPKSDNITLIRKKDLNDLSAEEVISHIN